MTLRRRVVFRVDAALQMGSGHVMRCLTLADALAAYQCDCSFICRAHAGHLQDLIVQRGYPVTLLPLDTPVPTHAAWLGTDWQTDATQTRAALQAQTQETATAAATAQAQPQLADWLIVDHYALDARWERALRPGCTRLMVIDDLADRSHDCDLLLDQNLGRSAADYATRVPPACQVLAGTAFALLRPQFAHARAASLLRRQPPVLRRILISMGGMDHPDATGQVLMALRQCALPAQTEITVVMGAQAPWLEQVRARAAGMPWATQVLVGVDDMAQCMARHDLAIGAAGSSAWERCCLGLPTLMLVLAANQHDAALQLAQAGAASTLALDATLPAALAQELQRMGTDVAAFTKMSTRASALVDGEGAHRVLSQLFTAAPPAALTP